MITNQNKKFDNSESSAGEFERIIKKEEEKKVVKDDIRVELIT